MKTLSELLAQVKELDPRNKHEPKEWKVGELALAAPVLAEIVEKVIEQRNHYHAVCYRDFEPAEEDDSLRKRNAELDAIVARGMGEKT